MARYSRFRQLGRPSAGGLGARLKNNWQAKREQIIKEEQLKLQIQKLNGKKNQMLRLH